MGDQLNIMLDQVSASIVAPESEFEISGYKSRDLLFLEAVAVYEGVNGNNALFERAELEKSYKSFIGKPIKIRLVNNEVTGHGYDLHTKRFDELVKTVGFIYEVNGLENAEGKFEVRVKAVVWEKYYPEVAGTIRELHNRRELKFSIEADRDFEVTEEGFRRCFNINFSGLCIVNNPAFPQTKSLLVAELFEGGKKQMDFEKMYEAEKSKVEDLNGKLVLSEQKVGELSEKLEALTTEVAEMKEKAVEVEGEMKTVVADRDQYKEKVELAEKQELGKERAEKLNKYTKEVKADELAELSKEEFIETLEKAIEDYEPENAEKKDEGIGVKYEKAGNGKSNKQKMKDFIFGLDA